MSKPYADIHQIMKLVPHRYPFLMLDRVLEFEPGNRLVAMKNVTINEPYFAGHFPQKPVMPGVLILEAMAQACGLLAVRTTGITVEDGVILYFAGIDKARFKRVVEPGDQLVIDCSALRSKRDIWKFEAKALVGDDLVCAAELMCAARPIEDISAP